MAWILRGMRAPASGAGASAGAISSLQMARACQWDTGVAGERGARETDRAALRAAVVVEKVALAAAATGRL